MNDPSQSIEKRQFARIGVNIPVRYNIIDEEQYIRLREQRKVEGGVSRRGISNLKFPGAPLSRRDETDYDIRERLEAINNKMDYLIGLIVLGPPSRDYQQRALVTELSGAGIKVVTSHSVSGESYLEICLELRFFPYFIDGIYGQVKRTVPVQYENENKYELAVEFLELDEFVTEELVLLTFEKQREFLRSRKG
ncbi:MAG: hypothetical protein V1736_10825 [Pseudomonadota bacterium]